MMNFAFRLGLVAPLLAIAACSESTTVSTGTLGASGQASNIPELAETIRVTNLAENDFDRIAGTATTDGIPGTAFVPLNATTAGTATYTGPGAVEIFSRTINGSDITDETVIDMLGTATITVDFASDEFSGRIRDMFAVNAAGDVDVVQGRVRVDNGSQADLAARPTLLEADSFGNLEAFGTTYDISAGLEGLLRGTNPDAMDGIPVKAISLEGEGTVANSDLLTSITIVGDKDAANEGAFVNR